MKIYDCFMFFDEEMLLDLRLNIMDKYVDKFIITEATYLHSGKPKKLIFDINKFQRFKDKIIYNVIEKEPSDIESISEKDVDSKDTKGQKLVNNSNKREHFQRNGPLRILKDANDDDIILINDIDEIPNLENINFNEIKNKIVIFKQKIFYYKFNLLYPEISWYGSKVSKKKHFISPQWLRELKFKKRPLWRIDKLRLNNILKNGGWHFCNLKSPKKLLYKYKNVCETNDQFVFKQKIKKKYLNENLIKKNIKKQSSIIGRKEKFNVQNLDNSFPSYLIKNKKFYSKWII